jgi:hypothetical protein
MVHLCGRDAHPVLCVYGALPLYFQEAFIRSKYVVVVFYWYPSVSFEFLFAVIISDRDLIIHEPCCLFRVFVPVSHN